MGSYADLIFEIMEEQKNIAIERGECPFPLLFENRTIRVYRNSSDEIFVKLKSDGTTIRISDHRNSLQITAGGFQIEPSSVNGLPAFRVFKRT